jgi:flagellar motor switch protein FliN/FliY
MTSTVPSNAPTGAATTAAPANLGELKSGAVSGGSASLDTLLEVTLPVTIEFGRTNLTVQEVLALGTGSVVQLDRMVGEAVDVFVGDRRLAQGEVVVVGEFFGVRVTRLLTREPVATRAG